MLLCNLVIGTSVAMQLDDRYKCCYATGCQVQVLLCNWMIGTSVAMQLDDRYKCCYATG